jgi:hypothetical protein
MRRVVRGLKRRAAIVGHFFFSPLYWLVRHHYRGEFDQLRLEVAALRQELAGLRLASLETQTIYYQQLADEFVYLQKRLEARQETSRAA